MEPIRKSPRGPPVGYVIDSQRYFTVAEATRLVGPELVCKKTMWNYAKAGFHPCGLDLCVTRQPLLRTSHSKPRTDRHFRYLLREDRLLVLRELLQDYRHHRTGGIRAEDFDVMGEAARRFPPARPSPGISV